MLPPALIKAAAIVAPSEQFDDAIDGVAFGDASEIQLHAGCIEARSCCDPGSSITCAAADVTPRAGQLALRRQAAFAAEEAPRLHQRTDGDVERAAGVAVIAHRVGDEVEQLRFDGDGMLRRLAIDRATADCSAL